MGRLSVFLLQSSCFPVNLCLSQIRTFVFFLKASTSLTPIMPGSTGAGPVADEL